VSVNVDFIETDLAPGDSKSTALDVTGLRVRRVAADSSLFDDVFALLRAEFGPLGEIEPRDVLLRRLREHDGPRAYELLAIQRGEEIVAIRDHQALADDNGVIVHLSHAWVRADFRRTGLAGWLRALPLQMARRMAFSPDAPITLVAEMEHPNPVDPSRMIRLAAYEKAGFLKIDPKAFDYLQPDFRPPAEIDASNEWRFLPFSLIVRRVGREGEQSISGGELKRIVRSIYRIYACDFRAADMEPLWEHLDAHAPAKEAIVELLPPTRGPT